VIEIGTKNEAVTKSHTNVGGFPNKLDLKEIIELLRALLKTRCGQWVGQSVYPTF